MSKRIRLEEHETALLIRASAEPGRSPVSLAFGPSFVALEVSETPWAVPLLEQWRGETFTDGGGI